MDDTHQQQHAPQPVVDDCSTQIFTLNPATHHHHHHHNYNPHSPQLPFIFPQQGFLQYQQNSFQALLQPQPLPLPLQQRCVISNSEKNNVTPPPPPPPPPSVPSFPLTFKADLDENIGKNGGGLSCSSNGVGGGGGGEDGYVSNTRRGVTVGGLATATASPSLHYGWQNQEDSAIRQPFW